MNFDTAPDRRGSGSYKWDSRPDVTPLWVADMDFETAPCIIEALRKRVDHGVFGYTLVPDEYYRALTDWFAGRHGYRFTREQVIYTSGVVPALSAVIKAMCKPGEGVIVQTPVYNCFFSSIRNQECHVVENPLRRVDLGEGEFTYEADFEGLERLCADPANTLLLLCNPHNPAGRCWTREELGRMAGIAARHGVQVVSDEIHCELTMPGYRYVPYGTVDPQAIVCLSPSKAFNTAGLQIANIVTPSEDVRARIDRAININEVCDVNPFGVAGLMAAYTSEGHLWLTELKHYLAGNWELTRRLLRERLPQCPVARLEATYLPWVDISALGMSGDEVEHKLLEEARVWVNSGTMYGADGYIRLNIACPRGLLENGLIRLCDCLG